MTFKKNVFVLLSSVGLVLIGAWLVGLSRTALVDGMTLVLATVTMALLIEDLWRKLLGDREKLTWEYFVGFLIVALAIVAFLWASLSVNNKEMFTRLGVVFLLSVMGGIWLHAKYKKSVQDIEEREQEKWEKQRKKIAKTKTKEQVSKILNKSLRYRLVGDHITGDLDLDRPLAIYRQEGLTYEEICAVDEDESDNQNLSDVRRSAGEYIQSLVNQVEIAEDEKA